MDAPLQICGFLIDMDGLLLDTERVSQRCWETAERETGFFMPEGYYHTLIGQSMTSIEQRLYEVMDSSCDIQEFLRVATRVYMDAVVKDVVPVKSGAREFLEYLDNSGIPRCLATSTERDLCQHKLERCGLIKHLPLRVCGDDVEQSKPAPDIYLAASRKLGLNPETLLVLEDSQNGLVAGMAAGCKTAHVPDVGRVSLEVQVKTDRIYRDLHEVLNSLEREDISILH